MNKLEKAFRNLNRDLDNDYQKLCDEYQELKLSHNRKKKLLNQICQYLTLLLTETHLNSFEEALVHELVHKCKIETTWNGRLKERW